MIDQSEVSSLFFMCPGFANTYTYIICAQKDHCRELERPDTRPEYCLLLSQAAKDTTVPRNEKMRLVAAEGVARLITVGL